MNTLTQLLGQLKQKFTVITSDSGRVVPGALFVAIQGTARDGHDFIPEAIERGASQLIVEKPRTELLPIPAELPVLQVPDARLALAHLAADFHGNPSQSLLMVGVTGTSGKTTTTYLIESILRAANHQVGVIGTVNIRFAGKEIPASQTTPDATELQRILAWMKNEGATAVIMEVSSHSLRQHRVAFTAFDSVAFTNLTPEHLDFHPDMEHYFNSKAMLFRDACAYSLSVGKTTSKVINADDPWGARLLEEIAPHSYGFSLQTDPLSSDLTGIRGVFKGVRIQSELIGGFNASNIATAVAVALSLGIPAGEIEAGIRNLKGVPGRLERVLNSKGIHVFVDYAHKPDALEKVLHTLSATGSPRLLTVFGCGGDRDRKKRPIMGRTAFEISDEIWVTSDNPRTENPEAIIQEILTGIPTEALAPGGPVHVQPDRRAAIGEALRAAHTGDIVLIAGKGHEDYQIIGTRKIHFDDREEAANILSIP